MLLEWRLKQIRFKQQKKLNEANLYLYRSITSYIRNSNLMGIEKEEILQQVMDMMLQAQNENKSMNLIIGKDYEKFCESIIEEYSKNKGIIYKILNYIQRYLLWMVIIVIFMAVLDIVTHESLRLSVTVGEFVFANIISSIVVPFSRKIRQKNTSIPLHWIIYRRPLNIDRGMAVYVSISISLVMILSRFILKKLYGPMILSYRLLLTENILYLLLLFVIIGAIEVYKRVNAKR